MRCCSCSLAGDVAGDGVDFLLVQQGAGGPAEPFPRAVLAAVAVFKGKRGGSGVEVIHDGEGGRTVVGMDEVEKWPGHEFRVGPAQQRRPCRIEALEDAIEAGDAEQVGRFVEKMEQFVRRRLGVGADHAGCLGIETHPTRPD
jgi:hypothetical protein